MLTPDAGRHRNGDRARLIGLVLLVTLLIAIGYDLGPGPGGSWP